MKQTLIVFLIHIVYSFTWVPINNTINILVTTTLMSLPLKPSSLSCSEARSSVPHKTHPRISEIFFQWIRFVLMFCGQCFFLGTFYFVSSIPML